jgi:AcrR family transcriptional regulator
MPHSTPAHKPKLGRPKLGTEQERHTALLEHALQVFMQTGYTNTSIAKIATAAGVSTRTIYEHYGNKSELLIAAVSRMIEHDAEQLDQLARLHNHTLEQTLTALSKTILDRITSSELTALYRIGVAEGFRFPELTKKMHSTAALRIENIIAAYLSQQIQLGTLNISNAQISAKLFLNMLIAEPRHRSLFGLLTQEYGWNESQHISNVVKVFLYGTSTSKAN